MGLIGWIKGKYYDSRLDKADNLVLENDLERAEQIYRELLGKQDDAATHFTNMLVEHSDDAQSKISSLKTIESLEEFVVEENSEEYKKGLNIHVRNMEVLAKELFNKNSMIRLYLYSSLLKIIIVAKRSFPRNVINIAHITNILWLSMTRSL